VAVDDPFAPAHVPARPLHLVGEAEAGAAVGALAEPARRWLAATGFTARAGRLALWPDDDGLPAALFVLPESPGPWEAAALRQALPPGDWRIVAGADLVDPFHLALGWRLAGYRFDRYRQASEATPLARLVLDEPPRARILAEAVVFARALVDTPASDLGPAELEAVARELAAERDGRIEVTSGEALARDFPLIHAVGRAGARPPRLVDLHLPRPGAPRLVLVGKGVCFDTGGLDLKPAQFMRHMKKDMGGAAVVLGLARALHALEVAVDLRVLVPAVDNAVAGAAFRPGDVLRSRRGLTVEIGNTDAEGRLILADALALADETAPDLLVDVATLTGAARIALGPDLPALFTPDDGFAALLSEAGAAHGFPLWRLPLHEPYLRLLESPVADLDNAGSSRFAGAITAALFLRRFVERAAVWVHLDVYCWNDESRPGRPRGGEASGLVPLALAVERWAEARGS